MLSAKSSLTKFASMFVLCLSLSTLCFAQDPSGRPTEPPPTKGPQPTKKPPRKPPVRVDPGPITVTLTVLTEPPESEVYINGDKRGVTNAEGKIQFEKMALGHYSIEVRKDGFNTSIRGFQAGSESPTMKFTLEVSLEKYTKQFDSLVSAGKLAGPESPNALEVVEEAASKLPGRPETARMQSVLAARLAESIAPVINATATNWRGVTREELARASDVATKALGLKKDDNRLQAESAYLKGSIMLRDFQSATESGQAQPQGEGQQSGAALSGAKAEFENAARLDPSMAAAHYQLGVTMQAMGDSAGAEAAFLRTTQLEPRWAHAYSSLGSALSAQNKHKEAIDAFRRAVELDPKLARAHAGLGLARVMKGDKEGIKDIERAMQIDPTSALPHFNLGVALSQSKNKKERARAEEELDKAIKMNSSNLEFQNRVAEQMLADLRTKKK
jgi:tetratricopeptide (TPR) repeat protein